MRISWGIGGVPPPNHAKCKNLDEGRVRIGAGFEPSDETPPIGLRLGEQGAVGGHPGGQAFYAFLRAYMGLPTQFPTGFVDVGDIDLLIARTPVGIGHRDVVRPGLDKVQELEEG